MDDWVKRNPRAATYILAVSILLIVILTAFLYYYTCSQEYMKMVDRELLAGVAKKLKKIQNKKAENIQELAEKAEDDADEGPGSFTIIEEDED